MFGSLEPIMLRGHQTYPDYSWLDISSSFEKLMLLILVDEVTTILAYGPNPGTKQPNN